MAKSDSRKKAKKVKSPFGNRIKEEAARKAAQGPDLSKTSIPELVEKAPKKDPNVVGFDDIPGFTPEQHSADTEVLPVDTTRIDEDMPPTEDAIPSPDNFPPTEILPPPSTDIPPTQPIIIQEPSQEEKERIAALETQVLNLEDTEDTLIFDGTKTEELDAPTVRISTVRMEAIATEKPKGFLHKIPGVSYVLNYKSKSQKIEDDLRRQALEEGIPLEEVSSTEATEMPLDTEEEVKPEIVIKPKKKGLLSRVFSRKKKEKLDPLSPEALRKDYEQITGEPAPEGAFEEPAPEAETAPPKIPESVADAVTEPLDVPEVDDYVHTATEPLTTDDEDTEVSETGETVVLVGEPDAKDTYVHTETEPLTDIAEDPEIGMKTELLTDVEEPAGLESAVEEAPMYVGVTFDEKYAPILMLAAGDRAVINNDNKDLWEKTLEDVDYEAEADPEKEEFRNYIFSVYASADGCKSKDKEILIYVLSELASASSDKGEHEKAFVYARRARHLGKVELLKNPTANTLHKWGMLEHNIKIYEKEMKENTVTIEA